MATAFTTKTEAGTRKVYNEDGYVVATFFTEEEYADEAFGLFKNGLVHHGGYSLYDTDAGQYLVGTVAQLVGA